MDHASFSANGITIESNKAKLHGAGIYVSNALYQSKSGIVGLNTSPQGAGIFVENSHAILIDDYYSSNSANQGGGIFCSSALIEIYSVKFDGTEDGNNLYCDPGTCTVQHDSNSTCTCNSC